MLYALSFPDSCYEGKEICKLGQELCGRRCYDPKTFKCFFNSTNGLNVLCSPGELICGQRYQATCYDPKSEVCHTTKKDNNSTMTPEWSAVCSKGQKTCSTSYSLTCYTPAVQDCLEVETTSSSVQYSVVCMKGQKLCDRGCYSPESHQCLTYKDE